MLWIALKITETALNSPFRTNLIDNYCLFHIRNLIQTPRGHARTSPSPPDRSDASASWGETLWTASLNPECKLTFLAAPSEGTSRIRKLLMKYWLGFAFASLAYNIKASGLGKVQVGSSLDPKKTSTHAAYITHLWVLGHGISHFRVAYNLFVFFKSIIDMQMIWRCCCLKISGLRSINKWLRPNLCAFSMKMLGLLQDNYSRPSTNMSNKTSQRGFSLQRQRGNFHYASPAKSRGTWHASLSRCVLPAGWQTCEISRVCVGARGSVCVCDPLSVSFMDSPVRLIQQECSQKPPYKRRKLVPQYINGCFIMRVSHL